MNRYGAKRQHAAHFAPGYLQQFTNRIGNQGDIHKDSDNIIPAKAAETAFDPVHNAHPQHQNRIYDQNHHDSFPSGDPHFSGEQKYKQENGHKSQGKEHTVYRIGISHFRNTLNQSIHVNNVLPILEAFLKGKASNINISKDYGW